ncbi:MAG: hypothetical protein OEY52_02915 [Gammaproteobacteria bacterium]|nr:hypothetical protein [Gammaproteobacteria bacterium]
MIYFYRIVFFFFSITLVACGGADSSSDSTNFHRLIKLESYSSTEKLTSTVEFRYNPSGQVYELEYREPEPKHPENSGIVKITYGSDGLEQKRDYFDIEGKSRNSRTETEYDEEGKISKAISYRVNEHPPSNEDQYFYDYDGKIVLLKFVELGPAEYTEETEYTYYDNGLVKESKREQNEFTSYIVNYEYDFNESGQIYQRKKWTKFNNYPSTGPSITKYYYESGPCVVLEPKSLNREFCLN